MTQNFDQTKAHIEQLVPGVEYLSMRETNGTNRTVVDVYLKHPKRKLTPSSFVNKAKKLGLNGYGTRGATGPTLIVGYVDMNETTELCIKGTNEGTIHVEVRYKT